MTSEQEVDELQQQVAALVRDNRSLMSRLNDLEDRVENHAGADATIAGPNYAHPNQNVSTVQFGDNKGQPVGQLDAYGVRFLNDQAVVGTVIFTDDFLRAVPANGVLAQVPVSALYGSANATGDVIIGLRAQHDATSAFTQPYVDFQMRGSYASTAVVIFELNQGSAGRNNDGTAGLALYTEYGAVDLGTGNTQVIVPKLVADPAKFLSGGTWIWSRSDTVKLRWRNSASVADNVAMEAWVTALAAPLSSAFVTIGSDATLSAERALTAGAGITITDGGAGSTITVAATGVLGTGSTLTIAAGVVTATDGYHMVDTEAAAATDDLDTVSGSVAGKLYLLRAVNGARDVVVKNGTGNVFLAGSDFTMDNTNDTILLFSNGTNLYEVARANNGA
jgi:hypothetical protein